MPGPHAHIWIALQALQSHERADGERRTAFLLGSLAPDLGYWPGGESDWSDLAHYVGAVAVTRRLLELSTEQPWRSFARGWLLHVCADIHGHPLINRFVGRRRGVPSVAYEQDPAAHLDVETGVDVQFLPSLPAYTRLLGDPDVLLRPGAATPVARAFQECYGYDIDAGAYADASSKLTGLLPWLQRAQLLLNRGRSGALPWRLRRAVGAGLRYLLDITQRGHDASPIGALLHPAWPAPEDRQAMADALTAGLALWHGLLDNAKPWPKHDINLDTGQPAARGEYRLADELMDRLVQEAERDTEQPPLWHAIRTRFEQRQQGHHAGQPVSEYTGSLQDGPGASDSTVTTKHGRESTMANDDPFDLERFVRAQQSVYNRVVAELSRGRKRSHWMWFVFPQIDGLGYSSTTRYYAIKSRAEAVSYLAHPVLGPRLVECAEILLELPEHDVSRIFGNPDDLKLRSSMTLFEAVAESGSLFAGVLEKYFAGNRDTRTLRLLADLDAARDP